MCGAVWVVVCLWCGVSVWFWYVGFGVGMLCSFCVYGVLCCMACSIVWCGICRLQSVCSIVCGLQFVCGMECWLWCVGGYYVGCSMNVVWCVAWVVCVVWCVGCSECGCVLWAVYGL